MCIYYICSVEHILYVPMCVQSFCFHSFLIASVVSYYLQFWNLHQICYDDLFLTKDSKLCFLLTVTQMLSNQNCQLGYKNFNYKYSLHSLFQEATCFECWSAWNNALLQVRKSSFIDWSKLSKSSPDCVLIYLFDSFWNTYVDFSKDLSNKI